MRRQISLKNNIFRLRALILIAFICCCLTSCWTFRHKAEFTKEERKSLRKCNTAKFSRYMGPNSIEIIRLCNLARKNKPLYNKYVGLRYGKEYEDKVFAKLEPDTRNKYPYLRPSFCLWLAAKSHAIVSGFTGYDGHFAFRFRTLLFLNLNAIFTKSGENCVYDRRKAIIEMQSWLSSGGHRANILDKAYYRTGVGGNFHFSRYKYNRVQCFTGPKLRDLIVGRGFKKK